MAKKKDKPQVINSIQELNLEIDYDKLADAIVKAQERADEISEEEDDIDISFWKSVWCIIRNNKKTNGDLLAVAMSMLMSFIFNALAVLLVLGGIAGAVLLFKNPVGWSTVPSAISLFVVSLLLALLMRGIANDISWENNKNYIVAIFSSIVSFAALIVALIALFDKGVG